MYDNNRQYYQQQHQQNEQYFYEQQQIQMQQYETADEYYQAMQQLEENRQEYFYQQMENRQNNKQNYQDSFESYYEMKQEQMEQNAADGYGMYGEYVADPEVDDYGVVAMCSALFEISAQCNIHMNSYDILALYMVSHFLKKSTSSSSFMHWERIMYCLLLRVIRQQMLI